MTDSDSDSVVAVFTSEFLSYSKTFIYDELTSHTRYRAEVFTRARLLPERFAFSPVHLGGFVYGYSRYSREFDRLFATQRYDVVHGHFGTAGVYGLRYAQKFDKPLVVTFHGFDVPLLQSPRRFMPARWGYAFYGPRVLEHMTLGLCASSELLEMLAEMGVPRARLRLHQIGVDLARFVPDHAARADSGHIEVLCIGRFVVKKGFDYAVRAFARAHAELPALRLTLIGDGEQELALRALASQLGIAAHVSFTGALPASEVVRHLQRSHILLAPSVVAEAGNRESGLLAIKEASACEVVPIGTLHGGIPEIIDDGVTGFLVPERDVNALGDRLLLLARDAELRTRLAHAGRRKMLAVYDNRARVAALEDRYDEARQLFAARR